MDPSLQELLLTVDDPEEELEVLMRLVLPNAIPEKVRVVAQFGDVVTCRIRRKDIDEVYASPLKFSLKASKYFSKNSHPAPAATLLKQSKLRSRASIVHPPVSNEVVVGVIDWGCDFTHPNFRNPDGTTRLIGLWDQSATSGTGTAPYGYGRFYNNTQINRALRSKEPFRVLQYHPAMADGAGIGAHGTHVMDIAAGNGAAGRAGVAPAAQLAFVHLGANDTSGEMTLGDSVRILEAIDFLRNLAGDKPLVINMSVGRHGGPHDGNTLVERAIDNFLEERRDTMICQSTGNYYAANTHASGNIRAGRGERLSFVVNAGDQTSNEIEIWYSGKDVFDFVLRKNSGTGPAIHVRVALGSKEDIVYKGRIIGRVYHRHRDPVNLKNHINVFLYPTAPAGQWDLLLSGVVVRDGRFHSWIERDTGSKQNQARFLPQFASVETTTGTICNGYNSLVVGAYDPESPQFTLAAFSSMGPTSDGRCKPDLVAPGVRIVAARSATAKQKSSLGELTVMSGTSMATPHVTGTVALVLGLLPRGTPYYIIRNIINGSTDKLKLDSTEASRVGNGILNTTRAVRLAKIYAASGQSHPVQVQQAAVANTDFVAV